jgi:hypothetical protein
MTPEGKVKSSVRKLLARYQGMYSYWPVPGGFGRATVDVIGCYRRRFFAAEVKAPGKKPTLRQTQTLAEVQAAMGKTFIVDGDDGIEEMRQWFDKLTEEIGDDSHIALDTVRRRTIQ